MVVKLPTEGNTTKIVWLVHTVPIHWEQFWKYVTQKNNKEVIVKVTDRGPHRRNLIIDLSYAAAKEIDIIRDGIAPVEISKVEETPSEPKDSLALK